MRLRGELFGFGERQTRTITNVSGAEAATLIGGQGWVEVQEGGNVDKGIPSSFVYCGPDGRRQTRNYDHINTVQLNFEAWADAVEGRAPYRFATEHLLANIRILDAVVRSAAADGKPVTA